MTETMNPLTTNWITSENFKKCTANSRYNIGLTPKEMKTLATEKETSLSLFKAMKTQRKYAPSKTMRFCGTTLAPTTLKDLHKPAPILNQQNKLCYRKKTQVYNGVICKVNKEGVTMHGVGFCQSPFCVTCMGYKRTERMEKIKKGLIQARKHALNAFFVTLTIKRSRDIKGQVKRLLRGWKYLQDKMRYRLKKQAVNLYMVRNLDITFRPDKHEIYHTHLHCIVITDKDLTPFTDKKTKEYITDLPQFMEHSWVQIQREKGVKCDLQGQHIERIKHDEKLSRYVSKFEGLTNELANFQHKKGKECKLYKTPSLGFMQLLGYVYKGDEKCIQIYRDFLRAMKNCRTVSFSRTWEKIEYDYKVIYDKNTGKIIDVKSEKILKVLERKYTEEEEEKEEGYTDELHISCEWFMKIGAKHIDEFIYCVRLAYLEGRMNIFKEMFQTSPCRNNLYAVFDLFD